jgi:hypothetical protein
MPIRSRTGKPDVNQMAANLIAAVAGELTTEEPSEGDKAKNPAAVALGRRGGLKGGKARWKGVSKKKRSELARKAVRARWRKS